ncbi:polyprenyl synthetase family protein [Pediococcus argentinicus]|uniref:polyprenyl synthetase family protein n=1 Tax=Pediococcus argentinicus TaxID=480391 RepID=UPI003390371B
MTKSLSSFQNQNIPKINQRIDDLLDQTVFDNELKSMMAYSIHAGGKRLRPLLLLAIIETVQNNLTRDDFTVAAALEAIHTYSLIHDDLPAMDNDDLRRGNPTSHKKFGEAHAILTGDALLTVAFQWLSSLDGDSDKTVKLVTELSAAAGPSGMVIGQVWDIEGVTKQYSMDKLQQLHENKTGRLLKFTAQAANILTNVSKQLADELVEFTTNFGLAYQIFDDIADVTETTAQLGKTAHKDLAQNKNTYPNLESVQQAKLDLNNVIKHMNENLQRMSEIDSTLDLGLLSGFIQYLQLDGEK